MNLVRFAHNWNDGMMECWSTGIMGARHSITLKNSAIHGINSAMDRKNINNRILGLEKFFEIKKGSASGYSLRRIWECHDCHEGAVIPGTYKNIHGETVKIDPKSLDPDTEVMRF